VIDLRIIRLALGLARHRNYTTAAKAMHISQPALSRSIASLEESLGVRLFDRRRSGIAPTAFGKLLLTRGESLLLGASELQREIALLRGSEIGELTVATAPYPADISVGQAIARLVSAHPSLCIDVRTLQWRDTLRAVLAAEVDVGVVELGESQRDRRVTTEPFKRQPVYFFVRAGHPLTQHKLPRLAQIRAFPFVGVHTRHLPQMADGTGRFDPETRDYLAPIRVGTIALIKQVVAGSDAVAGAPLALIAAEVKAGTVAVLPFHEPWMRTNYGIIYLKGRTLSPAAEAFVSHLRQVEDEIAQAAKGLRRALLREPTPPAPGRRRRTDDARS